MTTSLSPYAANTHWGMQTGFYCMFFKHYYPDSILFIAGVGPVRLQQRLHVMRAVSCACTCTYVLEAARSKIVIVLSPVKRCREINSVKSNCLFLPAQLAWIVHSSQKFKCDDCSFWKQSLKTLRPDALSSSNSFQRCLVNSLLPPWSKSAEKLNGDLISIFFLLWKAPVSDHGRKSLWFL